MIEPNRLTDPADRAARERVEEVFAAIDRLSPDQLWGVVIGARDMDERKRSLAILESAVAARRRDDLLDDARAQVRDALHGRVGAAHPVGTYGITTSSASRVEDRVGVSLAIDDAVSVAVAEDLLELDMAARLADPGRALLGLDPLPGLEPSPDGAETTGRAAAPGWEPSPEDWREAALDEAEPQTPPAALSGTHLMRVALFSVVAVVGATTAAVVGTVNDTPVVGVLAAVAIVLVCWTLATFQRAP